MTKSFSDLSKTMPGEVTSSLAVSGSGVSNLVEIIDGRD